MAWFLSFGMASVRRFSTNILTLFLAVFNHHHQHHLGKHHAIIYLLILICNNRIASLPKLTAHFLHAIRLSCKVCGMSSSGTVLESHALITKL